MLSVTVLMTSVFAIVSAKSFYQQHKDANVSDHKNLLLIDAEEVDKLFSVPGRRVRLTGSPIHCVCDNKALLDALRTNQNMIDDYESIKCDGGDHDGEPISQVDLAYLCAATNSPFMLGITTAVLTAICVFIIIVCFFGLCCTNTARERTRVIVLGDANEQKNLDSLLREFLQVNTYVQWEDPKFWDKLQRTTQRVA